MLDPPELQVPHPMPVTLAFLHEGLKRLRAIAIASDADGPASWLAAVEERREARVEGAEVGGGGGAGAEVGPAVLCGRIV